MNIFEDLISNRHFRVVAVFGIGTALLVAAFFLYANATNILSSFSSGLLGAMGALIGYWSLFRRFNEASNRNFRGFNHIYYSGSVNEYLESKEEEGLESYIREQEMRILEEKQEIELRRIRAKNELELIELENALKIKHLELELNERKMSKEFAEQDLYDKRLERSFLEEKFKLEELKLNHALKEKEGYLALQRIEKKVAK